MRSGKEEEKNVKGFVGKSEELGVRSKRSEKEVKKE